MQTTYGDRAAFFAGQQTKTSNVDAVESAFCSVDLSFGVGLARDLDGSLKQVEIPSATGFDFAGVAVHSHAYDNQGLSGTLGIEANEAINLKKGGYAAVRVDDDVAAAIAGGGSRAVFLRHTANGANNIPGNFRHNADTARADEVPGARFTGRLVGTGAGALAEIYLNTP